MWNKIIDLFKPDPPAPEISPEEIKRQYPYWRLRMMYSCFIGYAVFYFVRQNMAIAMPVMEKALGITKTSLGTFLTLHKILYGISKFANGILGDRTNPRYFMALGLIMSGVMNIFFGLSTAVLTFGIFWMLNGWFQGMGFPPCARILSHWFSPGERGTKWAVWNSSHQVGAGLILIIGGCLVCRNLDLHLGSGVKLHLAGWQLCFFVPALLSLITAAFLINRLRDTPGSLGLPAVEQYRSEEAALKSSRITFDRKTFQSFLVRQVFSNPHVWIICFANFFVYILRYAFLDWAPSCLSEIKGVELLHAGWMTAGFELFGLLGSIAGGFITDRYLKGRRAPLCVIYMIFATLCVFFFWKVPPGNSHMLMVLLFSAGFFIYGPQFLVGVMTADIATKHAAATAIGLTGFFGYLSSIFSGWGLGWTVDHYGWDGAFVMLILCSIAAALLFVLVWNVKPTKESSAESSSIQ